jgi:ATP-binding cassette subfamily C protein CydD
LKSGADIIFADEPTAHLDSETATKATQGLLAMAQGKTLIVATHDEELACKMGRVIRVDKAAGAQSLHIHTDSKDETIAVSSERRAAE